MSERAIVQLVDLSEDITVGFVGPMTHEYLDSGVPFFRSKNIGEYEIVWEDVKYISKEFHKKLKKSALRPGDVVIVRTGKPGTTCVIPKLVNEANCSDIVIVRVNDHLLSSDYLCYFMNSMARHQVSSRLVGAVQQHFNVGSTKEIEIPLPSRVEQQNIVDILLSFDQKIRLNRQTNQTLEQIAQAIFKSWFVDFEPVKAKLHVRNLGGNDKQTERAAQAVIAGAVNLDVITTATDLCALDRQLSQALGEKLTHQTHAQREQLATTARHFPDRLVELELGGIPEGWEVSTFSEIAVNIRDSIEPTTIDSETPYVGLEHIEKQQMYLSNWGHAGDVDSNKARFTKGDCLFGKLRPYFHKVCCPPVEGICSTDILVIRAVHEDWQGFVQCQIFDPVYVEYANVRSTGTRMPRANWRDMGAYVFVRPSIEIARVFTGVVGGFNQLAAQNTWSCRSLIAIRDLLLPKLLSGELAPGQLHRICN